MTDAVDKVRPLLRTRQIRDFTDEPLTEAEVIAVRNKSVAVMLRQSAAVEIAQKRGYDDIDPERCWSQWQQIRTQL